MDRTSRIGLGVCLLLFLFFSFLENKYYPPPAKLPQAAASTNAAPLNPTAPAANPPVLTAAPATPGQPPAPPPSAEEKLSTLENDALKVTFTSLGAAIKEVELKLQKADNGGNIILNEESHSNVLALTGWPGADTANFTAQQDLANAITFTTNLPNGVHWQRKYVFGKQPERDKGIGGFFRIMSHKLGATFGPARDQARSLHARCHATPWPIPARTDLTLPAYSLSVGRAEPLYEAPNRPRADASSTPRTGCTSARAGWRPAITSRRSTTSIPPPFSGSSPSTTA